MQAQCRALHRHLLLPPSNPRKEELFIIPASQMRKQRQAQGKVPCPDSLSQQVAGLG